ncbi:hypothetical protein COLO4_05151 [Corchorus olitorius]|uniref:AMMECR1 domain-containing protein n=1 Tax=Corchorus olitorius TaxID=93759 RepID=A0A1R3KRS9_9ROSI|nr:hypothetical protein COLO4_05151 [Corchorus olitorius]
MVSANREMAVYCFDTLVAHYNSEEAPPPAFDEGQQKFTTFCSQFYAVLLNAPSFGPLLAFTCPLFVTWKKVVNGGEPRLRGCIGTLEARCLINGFRDYALTRLLPPVNMAVYYKFLIGDRWVLANEPKFIGHKGRKSRKSGELEPDFTVSGPIARCRGQNFTKLVSETRVMGDWCSFQQQFESFLKLYEGDRVKDRQEREQDHVKQHGLAVRLEEQSRDLSTGKHEEKVGEGSVNRGRHEKRALGGDMHNTAPFEYIAVEVELHQQADLSTAMSLARFALRDRRFPPIQAKELPSLECTVSVLTDYETADNYLDWENIDIDIVPYVFIGVGKHGIIIEFTDDYNTRRSATYLPEVPAHEGWTKVEAIDSLMRKAGLNGPITESLRKRIKLTRYQSTIFTMHYSDYAAYVKATRGAAPSIAGAKLANN